jgi:hypothetical protein
MKGMTPESRIGKIFLILGNNLPCTTAKVFDLRAVYALLLVIVTSDADVALPSVRLIRRNIKPVWKSEPAYRVL